MLRRILIIFGYLALGIAIATITALLVAYGKGYSYDFSSGEIIRDGLLITASKPSSATVTLNGRDIHRSTPYRATLKVGNYDLVVAKAGYQTWHKTVEIVASEVTFAQYIMLIPSQLDQQVATKAPQITDYTASTDHRKIAYVATQSATDAKVITADMNGQNQATAYTLHETGDAATTEEVTSMVWSDDNSHLLLDIQANGVTDYLIVPTGGGTPINLTTELNFSFSGLVFAPDNWQELYWNSPEGLRRIDVNAQSVSGVLADEVTQLTETPNYLYYVQTTATGRSLWSLDKHGNKSLAVQTVAASASYAITDSSSGHELLAVAPSDTHTATLYIDPRSSTPVSRIISNTATLVSFSPEGRYLIAYSANSATTYDFNLTDATGHPYLYQLVSLGAISSLSWLDPYHFLYVSGNSVRISEFDGGNNTLLANGATSAVTPANDGHDLSFIRHNTSSNLDELITIVLR